MDKSMKNRLFPDRSASESKIAFHIPRRAQRA
jgi:hypothetical protein